MLIVQKLVFERETMDLILIACCNEKTTGGSTEYQISKLEKYVPAGGLFPISEPTSLLPDIQIFGVGPAFRRIEV
jgi:hypothetical protein